MSVLSPTSTPGTRRNRTTTRCSHRGPHRLPVVFNDATNILAIRRLLTPHYAAHAQDRLGLPCRCDVDEIAAFLCPPSNAEVSKAMR